MFDVEKFDKFKVQSGQSAEFELQGFSLDGKNPVVLIVVPATDANKAYANARLRRVKTGRRKVSTDMLEQARVADRELYPAHIIKGWKHVVDKDLKPVQITKDSCTEFLALLSDWQFDDVCNFATDPLNFVSDDTDIDEGELAKNSQSGSSGS